MCVLDGCVPVDECMLYMYGRVWPEGDIKCFLQLPLCNSLRKTRSLPELKSH